MPSQYHVKQPFVYKRTIESCPKFIQSQMRLVYKKKLLLFFDIELRLSFSSYPI